MNVASYSRVHPWPLCAGGQGLRATSYLFLFEFSPQPSSLLPSSLPLTFLRVSTPSITFPLPPRNHFLVFSKALVMVSAVDLAKGSPKMPSKSEVRQQIPC